MDDSSFGILKLLGLAAAVVLLFSLRRVFPTLAMALLIIGGILLAITVALVAVVLYFALRKKKPKDSGNDTEDAAALIGKGRSAVVETRRLCMRIKHLQVRKQSEEICDTADNIIRTLKEQPENLAKGRQFFQYYLPTLGGILLKYVRLEENGVVAEKITESTVSSLDNIQRALEKIHTGLFDKDILDLSVEMEVLTAICKRDGLLEAQKMPFPEAEEHITLTL